MPLFDKASVVSGRTDEMLQEGLIYHLNRMKCQIHDLQQVHMRLRLELEAAESVHWPNPTIKGFILETLEHEAIAIFRDLVTPLSRAWHFSQEIQQALDTANPEPQLTRRRPRT